MRIIHSFAKIIISILLTSIYYICSIVPKSKKTWVFSSWLGRTYSDNPRFFFEYVSNYHKEITAIWITKDLNLVEVVRKKGFRCEFAYSLKGIWYALSASVLVYSHSKSADFYPFLSSQKALSAQLWHGIPLKKIGFDDEKHVNTGLIRERIRNALFPIFDDSRQHLFASSKEDADHFQSAFRTKLVHITGNARNDLFVKEKKERHRYNIAFMPTFRDSIAHDSDLLEYLAFDTQSWKKFLVETNSTLYIKLHPVNTINKELISNKYSDENILFVDNIETNELLVDIDLLITDYSSVFFDFLLTERPVLFAPLDIIKYAQSDRSFYYSYDEITPGPICRDWNEVRSWIIRFMKDKNEYYKERCEMKNKFHRFNDGNNCLRTFQALDKLLNG